MPSIKTPPSAISRNRFYGQILKVGLPLVMSMATITITEFTDRVFLSNYDLNAIAAALPAGICAFLGISFFMGITTYLNVFVAQYMGADSPRKVGTVIWQGFYITLAAFICLSLLAGLAKPLFLLVGHAPEVQLNEVVYFRILCLGGGMQVLSAGLASFFVGRGLTLPVLLANLAGMLLNIPLNFALIYGAWGAPELGMAGAAIGTVTSWGLVGMVLGVLVFRPRNVARFGLCKRRLDPVLMRRIIYFGVPGSLQLFLDVIGFTFFALMVGRIGSTELAVTNMAMSINSLAFMPAMGFSQGISTLVGEAMGARNYDKVGHITCQTIQMFLVYILFLSICIASFPEALLSIFMMGHQNPGEVSVIIEQGTVLLRLVAVYIFFDSLYMIYAGVLKGAGDTRFVMVSIGILSFSIMILPIYLGIEIFNAGLYFAWGCVTTFIVSLFGLTCWRYRLGNWRHLRIIPDTGP